MVESIRELRKICQIVKHSKFRESKFHWLKWNFYCRLSIYITKVFLKLGISANQTTLCGFFAGIIGCSFFVFGNPEYWIVGILPLYLSRLFDAADGEIARYNKTASATGTYWDNMCDISLDSFKFACMTFGIYSIFHEIPVLIFGFIATTYPLVSLVSKLLAYKLELFTKTSVKSSNTEKSKKQKFFGYGYIMFGTFIALFTILGVAIIDLLIPAVTIPFIGGFNARYAYVIISGISGLIMTIVRVYKIVCKG